MASSAAVKHGSVAPASTTGNKVGVVAKVDKSTQAMPFHVTAAGVGVGDGDGDGDGVRGRSMVLI